MALCCARTWGDRPGCHELCDTYHLPEEAQRLLWEAVVRLCREARGRHAPMSLGADQSPLEAIMALLSEATQRGVLPPGWREP